MQQAEDVVIQLKKVEQGEILSDVVSAIYVDENDDDATLDIEDDAFDDAEEVAADSNDPGAGLTKKEVQQDPFCHSISNNYVRLSFTNRIT